MVKNYIVAIVVLVTVGCMDARDIRLENKTDIPLIKCSVHYHGKTSFSCRSDENQEIAVGKSITLGAGGCLVREVTCYGWQPRKGVPKILRGSMNSNQNTYVVTKGGDGLVIK